MKFQSGKNLCACAFAVALAFVSLSCQGAQTPGNQASTNQAAEAPVQKTINPQTPTEAYKLLFEAVKAKDTAKIQQILSKKSASFAAYGAQTYKQSMEKQLENGMLETTMTDALPGIRDERIKENFGAIEVFNKKRNQWDETPFVLEDGGWRLAVGDQFSNTYKSPGKSQAQTAAQAANSAGNNMIKITPNMNAQTPPDKNSNVKTAEIPIEPRPKRPAGKEKQ